MSNYSKVEPEDAVRLDEFARLPGGRIDLIIATLFINVLSLALPIVLLQIYDRIVPNAAASTLVLLMIGLATALVFEAGLRMARAYVGAWMGARFEHRAGCEALDRWLRAPIDAIERDGVGVHLERFGALGTLKDYYSGQAILVLCDLPFAVLFLGVIWYLAGPLVLIPVTLTLLFAAAALSIGDGLRESIDRRSVADDRRFNFIIEVLGGIHTVKSLAMENQLLRRYERLQETCASHEQHVIRRNATAQAIGALFSQLTIFVVVGFGALMVIDGGLTIGGLVACTMLSGRSMQPLQRALGIWTRFQTISLADRRAQRLFAIPAEAPRDLPPLPAVRGAIQLRDVCFTYGLNKDGVELPPIIDRVSMTITAGEAVGITGSNSSGKSTLLALIGRLLVPTAGEIRVDGYDLAAFDPASVRRQVAYLPQYGRLFRGTILDNITMFRQDRAPAALETAEWVGLHRAVARMPRGFDTVVGEGAADTLARGIKQRVAVARALVHSPRVLLFDEANTALDAQGDTALRGLLERLKGRSTLVIVTHRPSLLALADTTYQLANGRITAQDGPPSPAEPAEEPTGGPIERP